MTLRNLVLQDNQVKIKRSISSGFFMNLNILRLLMEYLFFMESNMYRNICCFLCVFNFISFGLNFFYKVNQPSPVPLSVRFGISIYETHLRLFYVIRKTS